VADAAFCMKCGTKKGGEAAGGGEGAKKMSREELETQISDMVTKIQKGPKPGMSHEAKRWKDKLQEDPYNLESMHQLGMAYVQDEHWEKAQNVMIRGLKRMDEFKEVETRYEYLYVLCLCSLKVNKHQQALMVLNDLQVPEGFHSKELEILRCQVYCSNGDVQKGIKSFNDALKDQDFNNASAVWAMCFTYLKKVDAYDLCRNAVVSIAQKEGDPDTATKKLVVLEGIANLKESAKVDAKGPPWAKIMKFSCALYVIVIMFVLYYLEGRSLGNLKLAKK